MWFGPAALALLVERIFGYPKLLHAAIGHPVEWMGWLVTKLEALLNKPGAPVREGRLRGAAALTLLLAAALVPAWLLAKALPHWSIEALVATAFIAQRSLREHVQAVDVEPLEEARRAVGRIVGRDPGGLDQSGVVRAALESLAENASDGVVAPAIWYGLLGLPGIVLYKAINTADSMIGHKSERYLHFGWAAARLDDLVNWPAARLSGFLLAFAAAWDSRERCRAALETMWRDAARHQSPNAGWPEAALAGGLGVKLGGPRTYHGELVDLAWMGDGRADLEHADIRSGLRIYARALTLLCLLAVILAVVF